MKKHILQVSGWISGVVYYMTKSNYISYESEKLVDQA